eukprot:Rmarinus@m.9881
MSLYTTNSSYTFQDDLWTSYDQVFAKAVAGKDSVSEFRDYLQQRAEIEGQYAKSLSKLSKMLTDKYESGSLLGALQTLSQKTQEEADVHSRLRDKLCVASGLGNLANALKQDNKTTHKQLKDRRDTLQKACQTAEQALVKAKQKQDKCATKAEKEANSPKAQETQMQLQLATQAVNDASATVQVNQREYERNQYVTLKALEELASSRVSAVKSIISELTQLLLSSSEQLTALYTSVSESGSQINASYDIQSFIQDTRDGEKAPAWLRGEETKEHCGSTSSAGAPSASGWGAAAVTSAPRSSSFGSSSNLVSSQPTNDEPAPSDGSPMLAPAESPFELPSESMQADALGIGPLTCKEDFRVMYKFVPESQKEVSVDVGEKIYVRGKDDGGWWTVEKGDGSLGLVPAAHIVSVSSPPVIGVYKAKYAYSPQEPDELALKVGETLRVLAFHDSSSKSYEGDEDAGSVTRIHSDGWFVVMTQDDSVGYVPANYLVLV